MLCSSGEAGARYGDDSNDSADETAADNALSTFMKFLWTFPSESFTFLWLLRSNQSEYIICLLCCAY